MSVRHFAIAMGVAARPNSIAVGVRGQIWFLHNGGDELAGSMEPAGRYTACYLARSSLLTSNIHIHEMAWGRDALWTVNTLFSCLCTPHEQYRFVPRWRPSFVSELRPEDRCHLNGLALEQGEPRFVTVMAPSDEPAGWRPTKNTSGCMLDVPSGHVVTQGMSMPHSPRIHAGHTWVLNSGLGTLETVDLATGRRDVAVALPGFTRGLAFCGPYAFVGLSRIRETAVFGGIPIAEHREALKCGRERLRFRSDPDVRAADQDRRHRRIGRRPGNRRAAGRTGENGGNGASDPFVLSVPSLP